MYLIVGWTNLARVTGLTRKALINRAARGTLPLAGRWEQGNRVFDETEVKHWIAAGMPRKPN